MEKKLILNQRVVRSKTKLETEMVKLNAFLVTMMTNNPHRHAVASFKDCVEEFCVKMDIAYKEVAKAFDIVVSAAEVSVNMDSNTSWKHHVMSITNGMNEQLAKAFMDATCPAAQGVAVWNAFIDEHKAHVARSPRMQNIYDSC